jgi:heptaprenyl diphosphate synthase
MNSYWKDHPDIDTELQKVNAFMMDMVSEALPIIKKPIEEVISAGGKMLRPALVILAAGFGKYKTERIVPVAASVEFLHTATLIHDDIIDEAKLRRGIESVQSKYSKDVAVLIGDYIFARTFDILSGDYPAQMLKTMSRSIIKICEGEISQYSYRYSDKMDVDKYIEIISGKTAALFSMSLFAGAYEAKVKTKIQESLVKIGYCIGMMFQIADDCLDYSSDDDSLGKSAVNDIKQGYITLPLFYALNKANTEQLHDLVFKSDLDFSDIKKIKHLVIKNGGVALASEKAKEYQDNALNFLDEVKRCESRDILEYIIRSLFDRTY